MVGLRPTRVRRYVASGLVKPARDERGRPLLGASDLARLRKIRRLTNEVGLNFVGVEVVLRLLDEIEAMRTDRPEPPTIRALLGAGDQPVRGPR
jgi:MerR family transcriptional regulator/heat shock protein HspR